MGVRAISAHGTLISHQPKATPGVFTVVAELGDVDNLGTMRNTFDVTPHNEDIDTYITGVMRRDNVSFPVNYVADDAGHIALRVSHFNNNIDGWKVEWPDGDEMIFSGAISNMGKPAPVDGALRQTVSVRPSGLFTYNGNVVGQVGVPYTES